MVVVGGRIVAVEVGVRVGRGGRIVGVGVVGVEVIGGRVGVAVGIEVVGEGVGGRVGAVGVESRRSRRKRSIWKRRMIGVGVVGAVE